MIEPERRQKMKKKNRTTLHIDDFETLRTVGPITADSR